MKKWMLLLFLLPLTGLAQSGMYKYFIFFSDKNNSPYSLTAPSSFLTQLAIDRRSRQQIPFDSLDLPVNPSYMNGVGSTGARLFARSKWFNGIIVECDSTVLAQILNLPYVSGGKKINRHGSTTHSKFEISTRANLRIPATDQTASIDYGAGYNQIHLMNGEYLHDQGFTGNGMLIAMLDAGFYQADQVTYFSNLLQRNGIVATWDFVADESTVFEDDSHGMECMSTIAADVPGQMVGTAPDASFILLRSEDVFSENIIEEYNWAAAAEYADSAGADLISSSLGYTEFQDITSSHTYSDMNGHTAPSSIAANVAFSRGMVVVVSAGNSGQDVWHYISAPGDGDSVLTAGAVDGNGIFAPFSSYGPAADGDVKPTVVTQGLAAIVVDPFSNLSFASGTSFSCPILAGSTACLWQQYPGKTNTEIKQAITQSASLYTTPNDSMGYGIPNFQAASFILSTNDPKVNTSDLFNVFPNLFNETVYVNVFTLKSSSVEMSLYNTTGEKIIQWKNTIQPGIINTLPIALPSELASGYYFLQLITDHGELVKPLVKFGK